MPNEERIQTTPSPATTQSSAAASTSKIAERLGDAAEQAAQLAHSAQEKGSALLHQASDKVSRTYREAQAETTELLHDLDERARHVGAITARSARRVGASTTQFVRTNALPLAVVGAGLGWLAWNIIEDGRRQRALAQPSGGALTSRRVYESDRPFARGVPPPPPPAALAPAPPAAPTTSGAKLMGVRVSDPGYQG
jgi:ElaB/YqjD/DUF883 family membrane-anchored ribosome-binding protein